MEKNDEELIQEIQDLNLLNEDKDINELIEELFTLKVNKLKI